MSTTMADLRSGVAGRPVWNFGDHTSAAGTRVRHADRNPGRCTIRVATEDRVGKACTMTCRMLVTRHSPRVAGPGVPVGHPTPPVASVSVVALLQ